MAMTPQQLQPSISDQSLQTVINPGDRNCIAMGERVRLQVWQDGGWQDVGEAKPQVVGLMVFDKTYLQKVPFLAEKLSEEMGLSPDAFNQYIESLSSEKVNVTRLQWVD